MCPSETVIVGSIDSLGRASVFHLGPLAGSHVYVPVPLPRHGLASDSMFMDLDGEL